MKRTRAEMVELSENTHVLNNNHYYQDYGAKDFMGFLNITNSWLTTQRNDKQLKEMFGKCSFASNDWEYYTRVWIREFEGHTYLIYSSEKGTSYEMVFDTVNKSYESFAGDVDIGKDIIRFMEQLIAEMKTLDSNKEVIAEWGKFEKSMKEEHLL